MWFGDPHAVYGLPLEEQVSTLAVAIARSDGDMGLDSLMPATARDRLHYGHLVGDSVQQAQGGGQQTMTASDFFSEGPA